MNQKKWERITQEIARAILVLSTNFKLDSRGYKRIIRYYTIFKNFNKMKLRDFKRNG